MQPASTIARRSTSTKRRSNRATTPRPICTVPDIVRRVTERGPPSAYSQRRGARMGQPGEARHAPGWERVDGVAVPIERTNGHVRRSALTLRQREIAALIARGRSNADIAKQLVLTNGTVANHVASILQRLDLDTRTQIATWAVEEGIHDGQDRLLTTLEQLLELQPVSLSVAMDHVATLLAQALDAEKVDAFLHDPATAILNAIGTSDTPLGHKQKATG